MRTLTPILYGLILCTLSIFTIKLSTPEAPEGMVLIPAGDDIDAFYIDAYEVTNAQYRKFIDANPQWQKDRALTAIVGNDYLSGWDRNMYPKGKANHRVVNISWFAAKAYAEWMGKELPTEAQWEKAARGALVGKKYPWGDVEPRKSMGTLDFRCILPKTETKSMKVATDIAAWLSDEMCDQFDSAFYSVSEGYTAPVNLDAKLADIVMFNTGYPQTFEKELIRVLREVGPEGIEEFPYEEPMIYHELILRLWRLYLEVHFNHTEETVFEKLRLFKARVIENIDDIILSDGC